MSNNMTRDDYSDVLIGAIDTIVTSRLHELQFDRTIVCTITDISKRDSGRYIVTDGATTFEAVSDNNVKYALNTKVQVTIPNNDWNSLKRIIGKYSDDTENDPIVYVAPTEQVANLSGTIINITNEFGIAANANNSCEIVPYDFASPFNTSIYNTVSVKADFKSLFKNYSMKSGIYGLRIKLGNDNGKEIIFDFTNNKDMFGDTYSFSEWTTQEVAFKLEGQVLDHIKWINISLLQNDNFKYLDVNGEEKDIEPIPLGDGFYQPNIFVKNIQVFFGAAMALVEDNTAQIFTSDDLNYSLSGENNSKNLELIWYNKGEGNKYLGFTDGIFDNKGYAIGSNQIPDNDTNNYYWIEWHADDSSGNSQWLENQDNQTKITYNCIPQITMSEIYAIVYLNGTPYKSNTITFNNKADKNSLVLGKDIKVTIKLDQESYPFYGEDNIGISNLVNVERYATLETEWILGTLEPNYWIGAKVTWTAPQEATMIRADAEKVTKVIDSSSKDDAFKFPYRLNKVYHENYVNNVITCTIEKDGFKATATKNLNFSSQGTSGTDYTLLIKSKDNRLFGFKGSTYTLTDFEGILLDVNGNVIQELPSSELFNYPNTYEFTNSGNFSEPNFLTYNVIKTKIQQTWAGREVMLEAYYPVIYSLGNEYYAQAPTKIIYDSFGKLKLNNLPELKLFQIRDNSKVENVTWQILYYNDRGNKVTDITNIKQYLPTISTNKLNIPSFYTEQDIYPVLIAKANDNDDSVYYSCPLIIQQYKYDSEVLNNWDGSLKVDNENNRILSAAAVFGRHSGTNGFSGVVLGDVGKVIDEVVTNNSTGIIGYKNGAQAYGFTDDGTAFIGLSGQGRLFFDGDKGHIASAAWLESDGSLKTSLNAGETGAYIDFQKASFDFTAGTDNFLRFNKDSKGKLEMKLSGGNIQLGDKNSYTLSNYMDLTAKNLVSEFRRTANYYATCDTKDSLLSDGSYSKLYYVKYLVLQNFDKQNSFSSINASADNNVNKITIKENLLKEGVTIQVTFKHSETVRETVSYNEEKKETEIIRSGNPIGLELWVYNEDDDTGLFRDIYLNGKPVGPDNPFGWTAGSVISFMYHKVGASGYWEVIDSGSYSRITQTADLISMKVSNAISTSVFNQTAEQMGGYVKSADGKDGFGWNLTTDGFFMGDPEELDKENYIFKCDNTGLEIHGEIHATSGTIGGLTIDKDTGKITFGNGGYIDPNGFFSFNGITTSNTDVSNTVQIGFKHNILLLFGKQFSTNNNLIKSTIRIADAENTDEPLIEFKLNNGNPSLWIHDIELYMKSKTGSYKKFDRESMTWQE